MLRVEWHPDKAGVTVVRTAYALLSKLRAIASATGEDDEVLEFFRMHVDSARRLPNLVTGGSAGHSLPTMVYDAYCTPSKRLVFSTPTALASELREDSSLGMALLLFKTEPAAGRDRRATDRRTTDVNAAAGAD